MNGNGVLSPTSNGKKMELSRWDIAEAAPEYENNTLTNEDPKS